MYLFVRFHVAGTATGSSNSGRPIVFNVNNINAYSPSPGKEGTHVQTGEETYHVSETFEHVDRAIAAVHKA